MQIFAGLALVAVVSCGGSKQPRPTPDTRQVIDPSDGVPGEENNYCCCQVASVPARYKVISIAACDRSRQACLDIERCE